MTTPTPQPRPAAKWPGALLAVLVIVLIIFHQDFWNWSAVQPLLFGCVPVGLWYHALFCVAAAILMWLLVTFAWPTHLETLEEHPSHPNAQNNDRSH